jgi:hypothetical protein
MLCVLLWLAASRAHQTALAVAALSSRHSEESGTAAAAVSIVRHSGLDELGWGEMEGQRQDIEPIKTDLRNLKAAW